MKIVIDTETNWRYCLFIEAAITPPINRRETVNQLTEYQKAQLLHFSLRGDFKYRNAAGNKAPRQAWLAMLRALTGGGYMAEVSTRLTITASGREYLNSNHLAISLTVLD